MGVVYSGAELMDGRIPGENDHYIAGSEVLRQVSALEAVSLVVVHGSVAEGTANLRSDLDVKVIFDATPEQDPVVAKEIQRTIQAISQERHVHAEPNIWPANEHILSRKSRMYDPLFIMHLRDAMDDEQWAKGVEDGLVLDLYDEYQGMDARQLQEIALGYIAYKRQGFTKAPLEYGDDHQSISAFQRALEFPNSTRRKMLQLSSMSGTTIELADMLVDYSPNDLTKELIELKSLDTAYTEFLQSFAPYDFIGEEGATVYRNELGRMYARAISLGMIAAAKIENHVSGLNL